MTCAHSVVRDIATHCFGGPVSREENRAAHGNVCITQECQQCGSRRLVNANQGHREIGPWGPSLAERRAEATRLAAIAERALSSVSPVTLVHTSGRRITISLDSEGFFVADGPMCDLLAALAAVPNFAAAAQLARRAVIAAADASEVTS